MSSPLLPPPPSSLSNRMRSKVPPRLSAPRSSPARSSKKSVNQENLAPNFENSGGGGGVTAADAAWAAFGATSDEVVATAAGHPGSPTFMATTDDSFVGGGGGVAAAAAAAAAAGGADDPVGAFGGGMSSPRSRSAVAASVSASASASASGSSGSSDGADPFTQSRFPVSPPRRQPQSQPQGDESVEVMRAMSPEGRNDFDATSPDWGGSDTSGWMREPIEAIPGMTPVAPPVALHSESHGGSDGEANAGGDAGGAGAGGAVAAAITAPPRRGPSGRSRGGAGRGRPPIGNAASGGGSVGPGGARPPRPAPGTPSSVSSVPTPTSAAAAASIPPLPLGSMSPSSAAAAAAAAAASTPDARRGRARGRSGSPAPHRASGLRGGGGANGTNADGDNTNSDRRSRTPRRRSRSRSSTGGGSLGGGGSRRGRSRSKSRGPDDASRRARSKSRGRARRSDGSSVSTTPRTPGGSRAGRSRSRTRPAAEPSPVAGAGVPQGVPTPRRGRSSSRNRVPSSSASGRSRSLGRSAAGDAGSSGAGAAGTGPNGAPTPSNGRGRSRSVSRPRGGPPLSASAGMAARSRAVGGGMTVTYASDGEVGSRPPMVRRSGSSSSSVASEAGPAAAGGGHVTATPRVTNGGRNRSTSMDVSSSSNNEGGNGGSCASAPSGCGTSTPGPPDRNHGSSAGPINIKRSNSFTNLKERLFGNHVSPEARRSYLPPRTGGASTPTNAAASSASTITSQQPEAVHTRTLLTASVYHNQATDLWITTINTNQNPTKTNKSNAARYLKAFSFNTEREARESAYANAPPKMIPFKDSPICFICRGRFAMFRRPCHCRNCGVCVCSSCSTTWPSKMIPETYNVKNSKKVKVCKSCNFLAGAFRHALSDGSYDDAVALYNTGNINLRTPFANVKGGGEIVFPIHCAAVGGNIDLLRWLVDVHFCPIKLVRTGNKNKERGIDEPILTSKGRSVLGIAMSCQKVDILRYLVNEKGMSVHEVKDLKTSLLALEAVLSAFPHQYDDLPANADPRNIDIASTVGGMYHSDNPGGETTDGGDSDEYGSTDGCRYSDDNAGFEGSDELEVDDCDSVSTTVADACILCYENSIDCVITPCGHQICCLECSQNLTACPVCNSEGQFIRIFKP